LKEGYEGQMTEKNIELGVVTADKKFKVLTQAEIKDYLKEAE
jgi:20S proteasome subunit alpha 2